MGARSGQSLLVEPLDDEPLDDELVAAAAAGAGVAGAEAAPGSDFVSDAPDAGLAAVFPPRLSVE